MSRTWNTRAETGADIPVVRDIVTAAFPTPEEAALVDALRADPGAWIEGLSLVAVDDSDRPVGHALLTRCHIGDRPAVRAALDAAGRLGERHVVVLGHPEYYPRFGFTRASAHGIGLTVDVPDEALMALTLDAAHPLPAGTVRYAAGGRPPRRHGASSSAQTLDPAPVVLHITR